MTIVDQWSNPDLIAWLCEAEVPDGRERGEEGLRQRDHIVHARGAQRDVESCGLRGEGEQYLYDVQGYLDTETSTGIMVALNC